MGREVELKYAATPAQFAALKADFPHLHPIEMETTYYDTPKGDLGRRKITLRRRLENGVSVCTLKTPTGTAARGEFQVECDNITDAIPILCKLSNLEDLLFLTAEGVIPVCGAKFTRWAKTISISGCTMEIALDKGILLGGGKAEPLCEVEVELKSGAPEAAMAFADALAKKFGLHRESKSKFRRALALAKGE